MSKRKKAGGRKRLPEKNQSVPAETTKNESAWADHEDNMNDFLEYDSLNSNNMENENQQKADLNRELSKNEFKGNAPCEHEAMGNETCTDGTPEDEKMLEPDEIIQSMDAADEEQFAESETGGAALTETGSEGNGREQNSKHYLYQWKQWLIGVILIFLAALYLLNNSSKNMETNLPQEAETAIIESQSETAAETKTVRVTGTSDADELDISATGENGTTTEENQSETENLNTTSSATESETETENWQQTIFGDSENSILSSIKVSGLTEDQKEKTGYRESDFLMALSAFLSNNDLAGVTEATFENEIPCSSEGAFAFSVSMDNSEKQLTVIMYPDYPGQYILLIEEAQETEEESYTEEESEMQNESEADEQAQDVIEIQSGQSSSETERSYDATTLSVTGIPTTLLNYLANRYELQYTLYDYLYRNGYSEVTAAAVSSYEIDADTRTATITFTLSDGSSLTGIYNRDENSYSYY
ncbi:MAG: hypothetical protein LUG93_15175 [Lachnospiraceae bacterium]|nr:hypothetical protein [Lachnospiraceae bacterium]